MSYKIQIGDTVRNATNEEIEQIKARETEYATLFEQSIAAKQSAKNKLAALGLTENEIKALVG